MTQQQLAEAADLHRTFISQLERGKKNPSIKVVFSLCEALDVEPKDFVADVQDDIMLGEV